MEKVIKVTEMAANEERRSSEKVSGDSSNSGRVPKIEPMYLNMLKKLVSDSVGSAPAKGKPAPMSSRVNDKGLPEKDEEQKEQIRFAQVKRKKDFVHYERVNGKKVDVLQGLELHSGIFDAEEQMKIVECVYQFQEMGRRDQLRARTYSEPKKWMRGKGRATIQFGCCYNYVKDKNGNPPGIIRDEEVDPLPSVFKEMIKRMVKWHVLPPTCVPNSCIVNIYDEGDCIPPHIDHRDFVRPFCTVSFLSECNILFGSRLKTLNPGEFSGPVSFPLPVGSVLVLQGNGADVAKHCVPAVPSKRISVTFRKMDESKLPYHYTPDPELLRVQPLVRRLPVKVSSIQQNSPNMDSIQLSVGENEKVKHDKPDTSLAQTSNQNVFTANEEFPPLGSLSSSSKNRRNRKC